MLRGCAILHTGLGGSAASGTDAGDLSSVLAKELRNFQEIAHWLMPETGEVPRLAGLDVWGGTRALRGAVGGEHLIYVDFKQRCDLRARSPRRKPGERRRSWRDCGVVATGRASPCSTWRGTR